MAFCGQCGKELQEGVRFCTVCGAPVETAPVEPAPSAVPETAPIETDSPAADAGAMETAESAVGVVKTVAEAIGQTVDASSVAGETVLSTWQGAGAGFDPASAVSVATQAIGTVVGQAQKVVQETQPIAAQVEQLTQPAQPVEAMQQMPVQEQAQPQAQQAQPAQPMSGNQTEQFKSHRPTEYYSSSGGEAKPATEKKKSKLPLIMIAAGLFIIVAVFALYVAPRFIFHPVDPNEHTALASDSSQSASVSASSASASSSAASSSGAASASASASSAAASSSSAAASSASAESASGGSATSEPSGDASSASSEAAPPAAPTSYSTTEPPTINDFKWMTGETDKGNAPAGVARITDFGAVMGGWKAYMYGGNLERLLNVSIDAGQSGAVVVLDWYYIRDNKANKVFEDTTASSTFTGTFDSGMLDATGSGRITLTAFWEQDGHQYATGSFMWPSGEVEVIVLVRP